MFTVKRTALLVLVVMMTIAAPLAASRTVIAQDEGPIILGAPVNLTDWMAAYDVPTLEGAKLAVEQINEAGGVLGRELQIIELDGHTDPAIVGNVAIELIDAGAEIIIAPCDFDDGAAASQAAQEAGIVGVSSARHPRSTAPRRSATSSSPFRCGTRRCPPRPPSSASSRAGQRGDDHRSTDYTQSLGDYFVETFNHLGGDVVSEDTYMLGDMTAARRHSDS